MHQQTLILNVDDNDASRHAKTRLLLNAGFHVEEAVDGATALSTATSLLPSLILLDMKLPDVSGSEVCRQLKLQGATRNVLVLHTSAAMITQDDIERGRLSGSDGYLAAPFEPTDLIATVRALLRRQSDCA